MRKICLSLIIAVTCGAFSLNHVSAREFYRIGEDYRALAMGGTGITTANNSSALFYNPAAMSNIFDWWLDFPSVQLTYSDDAKTLSKLASDPPKSLAENLAFLESNLGKQPFIRLHGGFSGFANFSEKGTTIGGNYTYEHIIDITIRNPNSYNVEFFERLDHIRQIGFSAPVGIGQLVLGMSYKSVTRSKRNISYNIFDALDGASFPEIKIDPLSLPSGATRGSGSGYELGFVYRTASSAHISYGGVLRREIDLGDAGVIPQQIDIGVSMRHQWDIMGMIAAIDLRDIQKKLGEDGQSASEKSMFRRLHCGVEFGFFPISKTSNWISIRYGFNQGYNTYGAEMAFSHGFVLGYTRYIEETGVWAGQNPSPRTVMFVSVSF